jgi:soluble lytic murein transglycosylase-like protein
MLLLFLFFQELVYDDQGNAVISNTQVVEVSSSPAVVVNYTGYDHIISRYCAFYGVDPELVKIVIEKESQFNPNAVSKSGAIGLMQLMPETAEILGVEDAYDPEQNIRGGVKFLSDMLEKFKSVELALAAYHAGPTIVEELNRVPAIPATMEYVDYIMARYSGASETDDIKFTVGEDGTPLITNR